VSSLARAFPV